MKSPRLFPPGWTTPGNSSSSATGATPGVTCAPCVGMFRYEVRFLHCQIGVEWLWMDERQSVGNLALFAFEEFFLRTSRCLAVDFECNRSNPRSDVCTMRGKVKVRRESVHTDKTEEFFEKTWGTFFVGCVTSPRWYSPRLLMPGSSSFSATEVTSARCG